MIGIVLFNCLNRRWKIQWSQPEIDLMTLARPDINIFRNGRKMRGQQKPSPGILEIVEGTTEIMER